MNTYIWILIVVFAFYLGMLVMATCCVSSKDE